MNVLYPRELFNSTYQIPFESLAERGIRGIIFDIDNTLVPHGAPADDRALCLFEQLKKLGISTCLLSNNRQARVAPFGRQVNAAYIYKGNKPSRSGYLKAMELMGTTRENTVFIGDQLFTDIYGANRAGIYSILVRPMDPREEFQIVLKRKLEAVVLYFYRRSLKEE